MAALEDVHGPRRPTPPVGPGAACDSVLRDYRLKVGTEVTVITLAPGYANSRGLPSVVLPTSRSYIGTIVDATSSVLVLEAGGRRTVVPWHAVASVEQINQPAHPGL